MSERYPTVPTDDERFWKIVGPYETELTMTYRPYVTEALSRDKLVRALSLAMLHDSDIKPTMMGLCTARISDRFGLSRDEVAIAMDEQVLMRLEEYHQMHQELAALLEAHE